MSIETERWAHTPGTADAHTGDGGVVSVFIPGTSASRETARARAIAVLPEALALLKRVLGKNALDRLDDTEARDVLRRAGVIE